MIKFVFIFLSKSLVHCNIFVIVLWRFIRHFVADHFSGPGIAVGPVCVCLDSSVLT